MILKRGALIRVRAFGGKEIIRRFLAKRDGTVLICSDEEYEAAKRDKRKPVCVGFPLSDVIHVEPERSARKLNKRAVRNSVPLKIRGSYHA